MSAKIPERYKVLSFSNVAALADRANNLIADGWVPQGGVSWNEQTDTYMQALYRPPVEAGDKAP